ncbi:MAG: hypothetical protein AAFS13_08800 [Pseudomonadota bacterium]
MPGEAGARVVSMARLGAGPEARAASFACEHAEDPPMYAALGLA